MRISCVLLLVLAACNGAGLPASPGSGGTGAPGSGAGASGGAGASSGGAAGPVGASLEPGDQLELVSSTVEVASASELEACSFIAAPGAPGQRFVADLLLETSSGLHDAQLLQVGTVRALDGAPGTFVEGGPCLDAANWAGWPVLLTTARSGRPATASGVGLVGGELLMLQVHAVNATTLGPSPTTVKVELTVR